MVLAAGYHSPFHCQAALLDRDRKICVFADTKMERPSWGVPIGIPKTGFEKYFLWKSRHGYVRLP
jgi:hypothetical protein